MKHINKQLNPVFKISATSLFIAIALGSYSSAALSQEEAEETSCDMGQMHEELIDRFTLPEIPSSLEDCGIGGFLNFDFSFGIGDFDFSSLFCDFAKDVVGNFKENMAVDFNIGMNGISINSPIYSMQTKGADQAVDELLYGATGVEQNGRGLLGDAQDAYRGTVNSIRRTYNGTPAGRSFTDMSSNVRSNSSVSLGSIRENIEAIENVEVNGRTYSNPNVRDIPIVDGGPMNGGGNVTIGGDMSRIIRDSGYTEQQIDRYNALPSRQRQSMNDKQLAEYLGLSEQQKIDQGVIPPPNTSNGRRDPSITEPILRGGPAQREPIYTIGDPVDEKVEAQSDPAKRLQDILFKRDEKR